MLVPDGVRDELAAILMADPSQLGAAYRAVDADPDAVVPMYHRIMIAAILDGAMPVAATHRAQAAAKIRDLILGRELSDRALAHVLGLIQGLEIVAEPPPAPHSPSVYVYSLPNYLRAPASPNDNRTWLKIGHSSGDPRARVAAQGRRTTGLPEDPVLLRVYRCTDARAAERSLHGALEALGHRPQTGSTTGREWFLTSLDAVDALAGILGLTKVFDE